jgi:hypothetical protein
MEAKAMDNKMRNWAITSRVIIGIVILTGILIRATS